MRIAIDASRAFSPNQTGTEKYSQELIESLLELEAKNESGRQDYSPEEKHEFFLFVRKGSLQRASCRNFIKKLPQGKLPATCYLHEIPNFPILFSQIALPLALRKKKIDRVLIPAAAAPLLTSAKVIYVLHGLEIFEVPECYPKLRGGLDRFLIRQSLRKAKKVIAVSKTSRQKAIDLLKINPDKIEVVYEGIRLSDKLARLLINFSQKEKKFSYFLALGRLEKRKNLLNLIKAFDQLKQEQLKQGVKQYQPEEGEGKQAQPLKLILAGSKGFGFEEIKAAARASQFREDIIFPGYLTEKEKLKLLAGAEALIQLSWAEGFGRPVLEALKLETPVIVSDIAVFRELYADLVKFVPADKPGVIAKALREKLTEKQTLKSVQKLFEKTNWRQNIRIIRGLLLH